jgi:hypothetical protein
MSHGWSICTMLRTYNSSSSQETNPRIAQGLGDQVNTSEGEARK